MAEQKHSFAQSITCPTCGGLCSPRAIVCRSCGTVLRDIGSNAHETLVVDRPDVEADEALAPISSGTSRFDPQSILYISVERVNTPIARFVREERPIILGRADTTDLEKHDVNLAPYSARERGVSRRHARLSYSNGELRIEDLNSSNGTEVNGLPLTPSEHHVLHDGDEITLGRMMVWVNF